MQNTTFNLYPTTSSSTAEISTSSLQHQLYLNMKSKPQDQAADPELWEFLKAKDHILKADIELLFVPTQYQLADIFTKPLDEPTFKRLIVKLEEKAKEKGVSIKDIEDSLRPKRSILTLKPLLTIDPKDKVKSILEEPKPAKKMARSDYDAAQIARDREEEASKAAIAKTYDEVQAGIDADALLAAKLQQEEREEYTIKERANFLAEIIAAQRKFRAAQRSAEIRNRPPTKSQ
ncbi:hypothetical protein Tco_1230874 [Tanacetum coccineum]